MEDYKLFVKQLFNSVSRVYDNEYLRFFDTSAERLVELLALKGNEKVLDLAAGTGKVSVELAKKLTEGRVMACDISGDMLNVIQSKVQKLDLSNVDMVESDMEILSYDSVFDDVTCSFGIFFLADMLKGLQKMKSFIKKGGKIALTTFDEHYFKAQLDMLFTRLEKFGQKRFASSFYHINTIEKTRKFLESAGFHHIEVVKEQQGYFLPDVDAWWQVVINGGLKVAYEQLKPEQKPDFRKEHLEDIRTLTTEKGIWLDVEVIFAVAEKP